MHPEGFAREARNIALVGFLLAFALASSTLAEPRTSPAEMLDDAELTSVFFLDPDRGWAVGDRGVIWSTDDGGRHWRLDDSPVNCRLESIFFVDEQNGWAVGGWVHPYTHKSSAVVLRTENGGRRWKRLPLPTLPGLQQVYFQDRLQGWAIGNSSAMYGSGVFRTRDGGRSWSAVPGYQPGGWLNGSFRDLKNGVLVGPDGAIALLAESELRPAEKPPTAWQPFRAVHRDGVTGWTVGDGGIVLRTTDGGQSWQSPPQPTPATAERTFDWRCLAVRGDHCWIAGVPGTMVLHSEDGGRSWLLLPTNQPLPLNSLTFLNEERGWAVGALGTILATRDGGKHWHLQRGRRTRAAVLGVFSETDRIPLELFTKLSGDDGYIGAVEILTRRDIESPEPAESAAEQRTRAAVVAAGASCGETTWQFPLRQDGLQLPLERIVAGWDVVHGGQATSDMEEYVVRRIRQWRPDVVITENASPSGADPLSHLVNQIVLNAVDKAADPAIYLHHAQEAGLGPWKVKKVFAAARTGEAGSINLETGRLATRLGSSLADYAAAAHGLVTSQWQPVPAKEGYQLLLSEMSSRSGRNEFFDGIPISAGTEARRDAGAPAGISLEVLSKLAQKQRNIQALIRRSAEQSRDGVAWLAQVEDLTRGVSTSAAGDIVYQLAQTYFQSGRSELAADALTLLVQRYPEHALAETALTWLIQYYSSSEVRHRLRDATPSPLHILAARRGGLSSRPGVDSPFSPASATDRGAMNGSRTNRAASLGQFVRQQRPALFAEPNLQFPLAAMDRAATIGQTSALYEGLLRSQLPASWRSCARGELWMAGGKGLSPKATMTCPLTTNRPRLDGALDDEVWTEATTTLLTSAQQDDDRWPAEVRLIRDAEFLYVAVRCGKASGADYPSSAETRSRDADLRDRDRLELLLDTDRDYVTYYRLTVDSRGWTNESCFGDTSWDPRWFVATSDEETQWIVEAAIKLDELTAEPIRSRDVWALGLQRVVPGVGFQSWTEPAAISVAPQGFGYLQFK